MSGFDKLMKDADQEVAVLRSSASSNASDSMAALSPPLDMTSDPLLEKVRRFLDSLSQHLLSKRREQLQQLVLEAVRSFSVMLDFYADTYHS
jgi:D-aminopeptidase